ncbi:hypothetical protein [Deinococcus sp. JMULE3]|uniref:hypothetical protein n=1 Tax=Deinococcus sp. JMULE3 TaxID=2518341 RepID=UPI00157670B0|nr:hypothetical protein [Deinococcus sp. JMULE3]NTY00522.1 hypothetical protein [Deinococcus sp. JMULE3]
MNPQTPPDFFGEFDSSDISQLMSRALDLDVTEENDYFLFSKDGSPKCQLNKNLLTESLAYLESLNIYEEMILSSQNSFEIPLREHSSTPGGRRLRESIPTIEDNENKLSYSFAGASNEYILFYYLNSVTRKFLDPLCYRLG